MAVIKGYEDGGQVVLMQTYGSPETVKQSLDDLPGFLVLFEGFDKPLQPKDMLMHSLRIAIGNWDRPEGVYDYMGKGQYLYGFRAFEQWAEDVGRYDEWTEKERELLFFVSWWCLGNVIDSRMAAVMFLSSHLDDVSGDFQEALTRAIALYQEEIDLLHGSSFERKEVFLGPWTGKSQADWTPEVRRREQELLLQAMEIEEKAIQAIRTII